MASAPAAALPPLALLLLLLALALAFAPSPSSSAAARQCAYTLRVKTSCASPARTSDAISVAFGDAYRNEAQAPRLPTSTSSPGSRALEPCGTDAFRVQGTCGYGVCYLYLRRDGRDGWTPDWVQVVQPGPRGAAPATATFYFGDPLPNGVWYGHDRCPKAKPAADDEHAAAHPASGDDTQRASNSSASPRG
ncbi:unnamed protein product [Urochloa humidicola]